MSYSCHTVDLTALTALVGLLFTAMSAPSVPRQDMPPPGGYKPIPYIRMPAKRIVGPWSLSAGALAIFSGGMYLYYLDYKQITMEEIESRSAKLAMLPLLQAEKDREYLKQLRRNRDDEAKLMANVEGWKVGTWYGEPIYRTYAPDRLVSPQYGEYYVHADPWETLYDSQFRMWI